MPDIKISPYRIGIRQLGNDKSIGFFCIIRCFGAAGVVRIVTVCSAVCMIAFSFVWEDIIKSEFTVDFRLPSVGLKLSVERYSSFIISGKMIRISCLQCCLICISIGFVAVGSLNVYRQMGL